MIGRRDAVVNALLRGRLTQGRGTLIDIATAMLCEGVCVKRSVLMY